MSSESPGTGRSSGGVASAYPFPAFPLVLSPQRAKSISTYAPQQQFYNHAPSTASGEYNQHHPNRRVGPHVVYSLPPSQGNKSLIVNIRRRFWESFLCNKRLNRGNAFRSEFPISSTRLSPFPVWGKLLRHPLFKSTPLTLLPLVFIISSGFG